VTDYKAELARLLDGIDLELSPEQETLVEVTEIAEEHARTKAEGLKHKLLAEVTPTEASTTGEFQARVSDTLPDRQSEHFTREGFHRAVQNFRKRGRPLPLLFGHNQTNANNVVGMITNLEVSPEDELIASGAIDTNDHLGRKIHNMLREGALQWSIGGMWSGPRSRDGVRTLDLRELAEVSIVPLPANERTRTLSIKADPASLTEEELRDWAEVAGVLQPKPPSPAALEAKRRQFLRDQRERQRLEKKRDYMDLEIALGEPVDAARKREREDAELRRRVDELRLQAAADFDLDLKGAGDVGPHAREKLRALIRYYMTKAHPWAECVRDNSRRFGPEGAKKVCAVLKDLGEGTTRWRKADTSKRDYGAELWTAADGNLAALMSMWRDWILANGDDPKEHMGQDGLTAAWGMGPKSFDSLSGPGLSKRIGEPERSVKDLMMRLMMGEE
jgi:HK97 family phage prohead protease